MNELICVTAAQIFFSVAVGGGKSLVFTIQIRTPREKLPLYGISSKNILGIFLEETAQIPEPAFYVSSSLY